MNLYNFHNYQKRATLHILEKTHSGLLMDMGLGKTICTLTAINALKYEEGEINKVLIIAPKRVVLSVWHAEIMKWDHISHLTITKIIGTAKQRGIALFQDTDIHIISRDSIVWLCNQFKNELPYDMLVIDELSSFKNPSSQRFKALKKKQADFKRVVGLTGTPAPNSLLDLWPQIYLLDRGERLGETISTYRRRYFFSEPYTYGYQLKRNADSVIHAKIKDICISMEAKDYLDLPDRINNTVEIEFSPELAKEYKEFEKEAVMELANTDVVAINAGVLANKLLQFSNGAIYDEDRNIHEIHNLKGEAAKELVENSNGKNILIAWTYQFDRDRLLKLIPNARELKGDIDVVEWNAGKIPVLLMHPASGGHGLNLQSGGNTIVWFGQTWSLELYQQLNARLDRQGQTEAVIIHHLVVKNTMDEAVLKRLASKEKGQKALMEATKALIKEYVKRR